MRRAGEVLLVGVAARAEAEIDRAEIAAESTEPTERKKPGRKPRAERRVRMVVVVKPEIAELYEREAIRRYDQQRKRSDLAAEALESYAAGGFGR